MKRLLLFYLILFAFTSCKKEEDIIQKPSYTISTDTNKSLNPIHYFSIIADTEPTSENSPSLIYVSTIETSDYKIDGDKEYKLLDDYENSLRRGRNFSVEAVKAKFQYRYLVQMYSYKELSERRQEILNGKYTYLELHKMPADFSSTP
jgi:hypothetical protein